MATSHLFLCQTGAKTNADGLHGDKTHDNPEQTPKIDTSDKDGNAKDQTKESKAAKNGKKKQEKASTNKPLSIPQALKQLVTNQLGDYVVTKVISQPALPE